MSQFWDLALRKDGQTEPNSQVTSASAGASELATMNVTNKNLPNYIFNIEGHYNLF